MVMFVLIFISLSASANCLCGENIRWSHTLDMEATYGLWYGVGYVQHSPDMTNVPNEIGCITLHFSDASNTRGDWLDFLLPKRNYSDVNWRSQRTNPWSEYPLTGSWLDVRLKRQAQQNSQFKKTVRVMWDEDGQTMEQTYSYDADDPGLWVLEQWLPGQREAIERGFDVWYPDDPPKHPEVIRILEVTNDMLIINHCSELGSGGIFTLILRRTPARFDRYQWHNLEQLFYTWGMPKMYRHSAVCAGCNVHVSLLLLLLCILTLFM